MSDNSSDVVRISVYAIVGLLWFANVMIKRRNERLLQAPPLRPIQSPTPRSLPRDSPLWDRDLDGP